MKHKPLFSLFVILIAAVLLTASHAVVSSIAKKPTVTEGEFPFSITYELDGETITINDVYTVRYDRNGGYNDTKSRIYIGKIGGKQEEDDVVYILRRDADERIELNTGFYPDYLMGDAWYDYFEDELFEPAIYYYDAQEQEYSDEETLSAHGVKLVSFEYPKPLDNTFVFSHISRLNGEVAIPALLISLLAFVAVLVLVRREKTVVQEPIEVQSTILFVTKEQGGARKPIDAVSTVINVLITLVAVPFLTIVACFSDIAAGNDAISHQMMYFTPALTMLGIAASVGLRRKGFNKSAFVVSFIGPVVFGLLLLLDTIGLL